jgi:potassium-transporting ATPase potassium-binding subunit
MTTATLLLIAMLAALLMFSIKSLGSYIANVMAGERNLAVRIGSYLESALYRAAGVDARCEMAWPQYAIALLVFSFLGTLLVFALQRLQAWLPLNPQGFGGVSVDSSFNTAVSFVTNTNWQGYSGESTMSYLSQMSALAVQNFVSAATGIAVAMALIRGLVRSGMKTIGNFWVDLVRATLYVLLPLSLVLAIALAACGVIQNFDAYKEVSTVESSTQTKQAIHQVLPMGPIASQEAIKELGTNGGGFLNANSSHPFENPTPISNFLEMFAILLIPCALTCTFGKMVGDTRQGWTLLTAMIVLLGVMIALAGLSEQHGNPLLTHLGVDQSVSATQGGGNMAGKEVRFGVGSSALWATITTGTSAGAVNTMHDSLTPLGGLATMVMMQLGEVSPGGVGTGLYSMLIFAILAVFIAGLMIGRTPEYLGKKIEVFDMKMTSLVILITPMVVLTGTAIAVLTDAGRAGVANPGAHGFSEILYAFTSAGNNNGSAFAGLSVNTLFYNTALGVAMWLGRFWVIVPVLAIAGSMAAKQRVPVTSGTMPTHGLLFVVLLIGAVLLVGLLTYVPALALGPIVEQLMMTNASL